MTGIAKDEYLPKPPREERVARVLVVGGGSSGWMAATMLAGTLSKDIQITLVESDAIGIVGVGEATIPPMQKFQRFLKIDEREFASATQGTFKLGLSVDRSARSAVHSDSCPRVGGRLPLHAEFVAQNCSAPPL